MPPERPFFVAHRDGGADVLHLSEPYRVAPGGQWRFMLSRRLSGPGGRFEGVVAAAIEVETFDRFYRAIDLGDGGFITLLSNKGTLITRIPDPGNVRGRQFPGGRIMAGVDRDGRFKGWTTSPITDERVLLATSAVRGFPLLVASGGTERAVFVDYLLNGSRSFFVSVNDGPGLEVPLTGQSWSVPSTAWVTVRLQAGPNKIKFYNDRTFAPDLDRVVVPRQPARS